MKKLIYGCVFLALLGIVLNSCKKEDSVSEKKDKITNSSLEQSFAQKTGSFSVENARNPNDSIGRIHNELLSDFFRNNSIHSITKQTVYDYFNADSVQIKLMEHLDEIPDSKAEEDLMLQNIPFNVSYPVALQLLYDLHDVVYNENLNFKSKINQIKKIEDKILDNNGSEYLHNVAINDVQRVKSALLSACSVGRYSLHFWTPISEGGLGNDGIISVPPDWVYADLKAAAVSYWFAWNPWALLASTAISSAVSTF